jgi:hypothetical protein
LVEFWTCPFIKFLERGKIKMSNTQMSAYCEFKPAGIIWILAQFQWKIWFFFSKIKQTCCIHKICRGFQYFSSLPVLRYLQVILFLIFEHLLCNILWN